MAMVFQAAAGRCQHMFAWLYINRVINRSITRSLADSCHFKAIGLRADPHKGMFVCVCVYASPIFHTITTKQNTEKTKQTLTIKT